MIGKPDNGTTNRHVFELSNDSDNLPVESVSVALVIDGHKVHHEHVLGSGVQPVQPRLECGKHPPVRTHN